MAADARTALADPAAVREARVNGHTPRLVVEHGDRILIAPTRALDGVALAFTAVSPAVGTRTFVRYNA